MGIQYESQVQIGRYCIDYILPSLNVALEVDGSYWHRKRPEADKRKDKYLSSKGFNVVRINQSECKDKEAWFKLLKERLFIL
jgi:very-short-patch-repair endonuclease